MFLYSILLNAMTLSTGVQYYNPTNSTMTQLLHYKQFLSLIFHKHFLPVSRVTLLGANSKILSHSIHASTSERLMLREALCRWTNTIQYNASFPVIVLIVSSICSYFSAMLIVHAFQTTCTCIMAPYLIMAGIQTEMDTRADSQ